MHQDIDFQFAAFFPDEKIRPFAYLLSQQLREGHICLPIDSNTDIKTPFGSANFHLLNQVSDKFLSSSDAYTPFVFYDGNLYLQRYFKYESTIVALLKKKIENSTIKKNEYRKSIEQFIELVKSQTADYALDGLEEDEKIDWQLIAVLRTLQNDFSIITGGPGTGKTTTLSKLLLILFTINPGARVALAAPTGKASMRMMESLKEKSANFPAEILRMIHELQSFTLHRMLGYQANSIYFKHNSDNPLPYDWIIVDEASMIDLPMFAKLLEACKPSARLLFLGDKDQLASVEAGSLLGDLCIAAGNLNRFSKQDNDWLNTFISSLERRIPANYSIENALPFSESISALRFSHRFSEQGDIGQLSLAIIQGQDEKALALLNSYKAEQISMIDQNSNSEMIGFVSSYILYMEEQNIEEALSKINKIRVLVTVREGECGLYAINKKIEKILHSVRPDLIQPNSTFYHNRPVMITKNNYDLGLFNGDIGIVRRDADTQKLKVYFEAVEKGMSPRVFSTASISDCETVFAMTIHKSQGSEFEKVMVVLPNQSDNPVLTRELLYTGVTRAKKSAVIMGSEEVFRAGINRQVVRFSGLHQRLTN